MVYADDYSRSSRPLKIAEQYIKTPNKEDLVWASGPEDYIKKLNDISQPWERIGYLTRSIFKFEREDHPLAPGGKEIKDFTLAAFVGGFVLGGIGGSSEYTEHFKRINAASKYDNIHLAHRHYLDSFMVHFCRNGFPLACKFAFFVMPSTFLYFGHIAYRGDAYLPDLVGGFSILGALHRTWLGPRAMFAGSVLGAAFGGAVYFSSRSIEKLFNIRIYKLHEMRTKVNWDVNERNHRFQMKQQEEQAFDMYKYGPKGLTD